MRRIRLLFLVKTKQSLRLRVTTALLVGAGGLTLIAGIVAFIFHFAQSPDILASGNLISFRSYQGLNFQKIVHTQDGNFVLSDGNNFIKTDTSGNILWSNGISQTTNLILSGMCETQSGDIVAACQSTDTTGGAAQIALIRLGTDGELKWFKFLHKQGSDFVYGIAADINDGVILSGGGCSTNHLLVKADADGNLLWLKDYSLNGATGSANKIITNADGSLLVAGRLAQSGQNYISLFSTDINGNIQWGKKYPDLQLPVVKLFIKTSDNCLLIGGTYIGGVNPYNNPFLLKTDLSGNLLWFKRFGTSGTESINAAVATGDGGAIIAGNIFLNADENVNALLFRIDANGNIEWQKSTGNNEFNGAGYDDAYDICRVGEHKYEIAGTAYWAFVCELDENGNGFCHESAVQLSTSNYASQSASATYTSIISTMFDVINSSAVASTFFVGTAHTCQSVNATSVEESPNENSAAQISVFPNPSDGNFNINYFIPAEQNGWMELYDLNGRKITAIELPAFSRSLSIHLPELPTGIYLYKVMAGGKVFKSEKLMVTK